MSEKYACQSYRDEPCRNGSCQEFFGCYNNIILEGVFYSNVSFPCDEGNMKKRRHTAEACEIKTGGNDISATATISNSAQFTC